jgi:hypothetical protein
MVRFDFFVHRDRAVFLGFDVGEVLFPAHFDVELGFEPPELVLVGNDHLGSPRDVPAVCLRFDGLGHVVGVVVHRQEELKQPHAIRHALGVDQVIIRPPAVEVFRSAERFDFLHLIDGLVEDLHREPGLDDFFSRLGAKLRGEERIPVFADVELRVMAGKELVFRGIEGHDHLPDRPAEIAVFDFVGIGQPGQEQRRVLLHVQKMIFPLSFCARAREIFFFAGQDEKDAPRMLGDADLFVGPEARVEHVPAVVEAVPLQLFGECGFRTAVNPEPVPELVLGILPANPGVGIAEHRLPSENVNRRHRPHLGDGLDRLVDVFPVVAGFIRHDHDHQSAFVPLHALSVFTHDFLNGGAHVFFAAGSIGIFLIASSISLRSAVGALICGVTFSP